jgi:hypothetical protein
MGQENINVQGVGIDKTAKWKAINKQKKGWYFWDSWVKKKLKWKGKCVLNHEKTKKNILWGRLMIK